MKNCLIFVANPNPKSFGHQMATSFKKGIDNSGNSAEIIDLYALDYENNHLSANQQFKEMILNADSLAFAFPIWWEMPPSPLVKFLQTIFVKDFAYTHDGVKKTNLIDKNVAILATMGQKKHVSFEYLFEAFEYCGMDTTAIVVASGVNPSFTSADANKALERAFTVGSHFFRN